MKAKIHPKYFPEAKVECACGNTFTIGSTKESIRVEICSNCHPLYTGKQNLVDTAGRVDRFKDILKKSGAAKDKVRARKAAKKSVKKDEPKAVKKAAKKTAAPKAKA